VLRAHNILYDKDESGEYLQAIRKASKTCSSSRSLSGAATRASALSNASIRLAAQARLAPPAAA